MYDQTILTSRTGKRLLQLFDDMEYVMSEMYHNTLRKESPQMTVIESEYMRIFEDIEELRRIRDKVISKRRKYKRMF